MEIDELPNLEWAAAEVLHDANIRAGSSIPGTPTFPLVVIVRGGGISPAKQRLDGGRIQFTSVGLNKTDAWETINAARVAIYGMEGTTVEYGSDAAFIAAVNDEHLPVYSQDPDTKRDRYIWTSRIVAHIAAPASSS